MTILAQWSDGALPAFVGSTVATSATGPRPACIRIAQDSGAKAFVQWDFTETAFGSHRFYFKTPTAWPSTSVTVFIAKVGDTLSNVRVSFTGTGSPGKLRLLDAAGATVAETPQKPLSLDTWYRVEVRINQAAGTAMVALYPDDSTVSLWESGTITGSFGSSHNRVSIGQNNSTPAVGTFYIDDVVLTDNHTAWVGSAAPYTPVPKTKFIQWLNGTGDAWTGSNGSVAVAGNYIAISPEPVVGRGKVEWNNATTITTGLAFRTYFRYQGSSWASQAIEMFNVMAEGYATVWRVQVAGPAQGTPGQLRLLDGSGAIVATSGARYLPLGRWRRIEATWNATGVKVTVYNRFDQVAFSMSAPIPLAPYKIISIGHPQAVPATWPELDVNGILASSLPSEPLGVVPGIVPAQADDSGIAVLVGGVLKPVTKTQVWVGGRLRSADITTA